MIRNCSHPKESLSIVVVEAAVGCETTRVLCSECNEFITEPKIEC